MRFDAAAIHAPVSLQRIAKRDNMIHRFDNRQWGENIMRSAIAVACATVVIAWTQPAPAQSSLPDVAARIELRAIPTLTLSDQQFLTGDKNGKPVTVAGELRFPQGATGKLPAVILLHGSGGANGGHELWARHFNQMGVAALLIDSFSGRDIVGTSTNQALLGRYNMILDAYRGLEMLAAHPRIDGTRVAVMGWSRGGQSALYASLKRFQQTWGAGHRFAAHVPLYASCSATLIGDTELTGAPIRQHHGVADDYVTIEPCRGYFARLRAAGNDVALIEYPDAHHSYDNPLGSKTPRMSKGSESTRACTLREQPLGVIINEATGQPFSYKDACIQRDPHVGYHEAAANATRTSVKAFLRTVFKLD
jgi:dienelactone hydrolase